MAVTDTLEEERKTIARQRHTVSLLAPIIGSAYDGTPYGNNSTTATITTTAGEYKFGGGAAKFSRDDRQYVRINTSPVTGTDYIWYGIAPASKPDGP